MKKKLLLLDLISGVWPHSLLAQQTLSQIDPSHYEVDYVSCGAAFKGYCTVNESYGRRFPVQERTKNPDCKQCKFSANVSFHSLKSNELAKKIEFFPDGDARQRGRKKDK